MMNNIVTKLSYRVDIKKLQDYYEVVQKNYQDLNWNWHKHGDDIIDQWKAEIAKNPANLLTHGWAIQSNLKDLSLPCPPWNISRHETTNYRNTKLAFGIIKELQITFPFAYRWAISVQPPGGTVSLHSDQQDEFTVWIPIYSEGISIVFVDNYENKEVCLTSDGSLYLLDTRIPHFTVNNSVNNRVTIIFRLNTKYLNTLLSTE